MASPVLAAYAGLHATFGQDALRLAFIGACFVVHPQVAQAVAELWAILKDGEDFNPAALHSC